MQPVAPVDDHENPPAVVRQPHDGTGVPEVDQRAREPLGIHPHLALAEEERARLNDILHLPPGLPAAARQLAPDPHRGSRARGEELPQQVRVAPVPGQHPSPGHEGPAAFPQAGALSSAHHDLCSRDGRHTRGRCPVVRRVEHQLIPFYEAVHGVQGEGPPVRRDGAAPGDLAEGGLVVLVPAQAGPPLIGLVHERAPDAERPDGQPAVPPRHGEEARVDGGPDPCGTGHLRQRGEGGGAAGRKDRLQPVAFGVQRQGGPITRQELRIPVRDRRQDARLAAPRADQVEQAAHPAVVLQKPAAQDPFVIRLGGRHIEPLALQEALKRLGLRFVVEPVRVDPPLGDTGRDAAPVDAQRHPHRGGELHIQLEADARPADGGQQAFRLLVRYSMFAPEGRDSAPNQRGVHVHRHGQAAAVEGRQGLHVLEGERKARQDLCLDLQPQGLDAPSQRIPARRRRVQLPDGVRHQSAPQEEGRAILFPGGAPVQAAGVQKTGEEDASGNRSRLGPRTEEQTERQTENKQTAHPTHPTHPRNGGRPTAPRDAPTHAARSPCFHTDLIGRAPEA